MSDDVCGAECVDGSTCQHPAGSCPVPSHSDPDADNPQGRDFTLGEDDHDDLLEAARMGASKAGCARAAGVDEKNLRRYLSENDDFRRAFTQARAEGEQKLLRGPLLNSDDPADPDMDGQHARFLLSTSFDYVKTERQEVEHSGEGGGPLELSIQREVVGSDDN